MNSKLIVVKVNNYDETGNRQVWIKNYPQGLTNGFSSPKECIRHKLSDVYTKFYKNWEFEFDVEEPHEKHFGVMNWSNI